MAKKKQKIVLMGGKKYPVIEEMGKYYRCANTQFLKTNPHIQLKEIDAKTDEE